MQVNRFSEQEPSLDTSFAGCPSATLLPPCLRARTLSVAHGLTAWALTYSQVLVRDGLGEGVPVKRSRPGRTCHLCAKLRLSGLYIDRACKLDLVERTDG